MQATMDLLARALDQQNATAWAKKLGFHRNAIHNAKSHGHLTPVIAGALAIELNEDPAKWITLAVIEGEKDSPAKARLIKSLGEWRKS